MMRFFFSLLATTLALPVFLGWSRAQAEEQIDQMQQAAFNTPGAAAPIPPAVLLGGVGLLSGHFFWARLLKLPTWQALLSLAGGLAAGAGLYVIKSQQDAS